MEITERKWRNLNDKLNRISGRLNEIERTMVKRGKKWLSFDECIPPTSICKDVISMLDGIQKFDGFIAKLADYYGCKKMPVLIDSTINPKYIAEYRNTDQTAYTRNATVNRSVVLHEWFHHLVNVNVVSLHSNAKHEHWADKYAEIFLERANA